MTGWKSTVILGSFLLILGLAAAGHSEILGDYLGYTACEACHPDKAEGWETTPHAHAFDSLKTQGEEKQENPGCVQCHTVAYNQDGGFIDMELTPELKDVQCESCHGPGRIHTETLSAEDIIKPGEDTCRTCHTEGQDKEFDFEKKSQLVHGE
jgi:hypothetical protein